MDICPLGGVAVVGWNGAPHCPPHPSGVLSAQKVTETLPPIAFRASQRNASFPEGNGTIAPSIPVGLSRALCAQKVKETLHQAAQ